MRGFRLRRLFVLAVFATSVSWGATPTITSLNASLVGGTPPVPAVTAITSGSLALDSFILYINGSFNDQDLNTVTWTDPTSGPTTLTTVSVTPTLITAQVTLPLYQKLVASPVSVTITVEEMGVGPSNPAIFTINPPLTQPSTILAVGTVGQTYAADVVDFGTPPYNIVSGTLPGGLNLVGIATGVQLTGVPTTVGVFGMKPTITDFWGNAITASATVQIVANAVLTSLSPNSAVAGSPGLTLIVNGSNFEVPNPALASPGSQVRWTFGPSTVALATTFVNGNQLQAAVPAALLVAAGTASVSVVQPSNVSSAALLFVILAPAITSLSPARVATNSTGFTLTVTGSSFLPASVISFGGTPLPTTLAGGALTAVVPASLLTTSGTFPVVVTNPGGSVSAPATFTVAPTITSLSPSNIPSGSAAFTLTVSGATFVASLPALSASSVVSFNGVALVPTVVVNAGLLTATVPASLITTPGSYPVVVTNPGGNASAPATFTVTIGLTIVTTSLPSGAAGSPYTATLVGRGGTPPYTWGVSGLPPALTVSPSTGVISGPAQQGGTFIVNVTLKDSVGASTGAQLPLVIAAPPVTISPGGLPNGTVGVPYAGLIGATGGTGPYTFSLGGGKLPDGLSLSAGGSVVGTPQTPGTFTFSVNVTDSAGASTGRDFSITIAPAPLVVTGGTSNNTGTAGTPISIPFGATGGVGPYRCTESGPLPPGTTFSACTLSGTPTTPGTYTFRVTVTDSTGVSATKDVTIAIAAPALTLGGTVGNGQVGVAYTGQLTASGGVPPYSYSASGLPDGLTGSSSGAITGTPTTAGQYSIVGAVADSNGGKANATFRITIAPAALTITTTSLPDGALNSPYTATLKATGGVQPYTWSATGLPDGLSVTTTGVISGTPTATGKFTVSVTVKDSSGIGTDSGAGATASQRYTVTIGPAAIVITTTAIANGTVGAAYSQPFLATGGVPPFSWSATGLPAGLTMSPAGTISGTPGAPGSFPFTVTAKDTVGGSGSKPFTLTVGLPPTPPLTFNGITNTAPPLQQPQLTISLGNAYPLDLVVTLTLTFAPDSGSDDPSIQFSTGGRTTRITVPAGSTVGASGVGLQTGSVAGLITITSQLVTVGQDVTPKPAPQSTIRIAATAPVPTTITAARNSTGFTVTIMGYVTDREVTQGLYTFNAAPGGNLQTTNLTVAVDTLFSQYFSGATATPFGGQFLYMQPFTINGNQQAVVSVTVTLVNKIGQSTAATVNLN